MRRREQKRRKTKMSIISKNNKNKKKANDFGYKYIIYPTNQITNFFTITVFYYILKIKKSPTLFSSYTFEGIYIIPIAFHPSFYLSNTKHPYWDP